MLTKWGKILTNLSSRGNSVPDMDGSGTHYGVVPGKSLGNTESYLTWNANDQSYGLRISTMTDNSSSGIFVGTGNTAPTEDDYCLESVISSGLSGTATKNNLYDETNGLVGVRFTLTLSNTTSADIIVSEVARCIKFSTASTRWGSLNAGVKCFMIDRSVLANPVTIPAGEAGVIYYDFIYYTESSEDPEP